MESAEPGYSYINGRFVPLAEAAIPLLDWGFNKSDVVYDGIPFTKGKIFRLEDHLNRFRSSMHKWRLPEAGSPHAIADVCHDLVVRSELEDGIIYICTTRGIPPSASVRDPSRFTSRFYAWSQQVPDIGSSDAGLRMIISSIPRIPSSSVDATAKNFHWGDLIQARLEAADRGVQNAILLGQDGMVAEGVGFNVFAVIGGDLLTPERDCLHGITRRTVLEIAAELGVDAYSTDISAHDLLHAEEIFISSSAGGLFAVVELDGAKISQGRTGPLCDRIHNIYWQWRVSPEKTVPVDYRALRCHVS